MLVGLGCLLLQLAFMIWTHSLRATALSTLSEFAVIASLIWVQLVVSIA